MIEPLTPAEISELERATLKNGYVGWGLIARFFLQRLPPHAQLDAIERAYLKTRERFGLDSPAHIVSDFKHVIKITDENSLAKISYGLGILHARELLYRQRAANPALQRPAANNPPVDPAAD